jgi:hypothetical protein
MPFTFAHPAIVLPFVYLPRKWISMTALMIGSIMPDAESYLRMYSEKEITHSWTGFFLFGLPFGLLLTFAFHNIVRDPLINNLPNFLYQRFSRFINFNWNKRFLKKWVVVILSLVAGGASHFAWDSFSHFDGWFINTFPRLQGNVHVFGKLLEIPFLIQYVNTLLGVIIMLIFIAALPRSGGNKPPVRSWKFWTWVIITAVVIFSARTIFLHRSTLDDNLIGITSAFLYALVLVAFLIPGKQSRQTSS